MLPAFFLVAKIQMLFFTEDNLRKFTLRKIHGLYQCPFHTSPPKVFLDEFCCMYPNFTSDLLWLVVPLKKASKQSANNILKG